jgi:hypothetical protein
MYTPMHHVLFVLVTRPARGIGLVSLQMHCCSPASCACLICPSRLGMTTGNSEEVRRTLFVDVAHSSSAANEDTSPAALQLLGNSFQRYGICPVPICIYLVVVSNMILTLTSLGSWNHLLVPGVPVMVAS